MARHPILTALAATVGIPAATLGLAGCATQPDNATAARALESSIVTAIPEANGAFVSFSSSGPTQRDVLVILYLKSGDTATAASAVDAGFKTAWKDVPFTPQSVAVGAVEGERPEHPKTYNAASIDPTAIAALLKLPATAATDIWISLPAADLAERYGARATPAP